jgi:hypothetical protein
MQQLKTLDSESGGSDVSPVGSDKYIETLGLKSRFNDQNRVFTCKPGNWAQSFPFQFVMRDIVLSQDFIFAMPISPEQYSMTAIQASKVTPGIGGIVEETSETTFYQISLQGTFSPAIGRVDLGTPTQGLSDTRGVIATGGLVTSAINNVLSVANPIASAIDSGSARGALDSIFTTVQPFAQSAVKQGAYDNGAGNGFGNILELQRFFHEYSAIKEKSPDDIELYFRDFKRNQQYRCTVTGFSTSQNASDPFSHSYSISMLCWNLTDPDAPAKAIDRFGPDGDLNIASSLSVTASLAKARGLVGTLGKFSKNPASIAGSIFRKPTL